MIVVRRSISLLSVLLVGAALAGASGCGGEEDGDGAGGSGSAAGGTNAGSGGNNGGSSGSSSGGQSGGGTGGSAGGEAGAGGSAGNAGSGGVPTVCGNLVCDDDETCDGCQIDCGACDTPPVTECNDGIDNDDDGLVDWQFDVGCWSGSDTTEAAGTRAEESGFTTFDLTQDSMIIHVSSSEGDDDNDGLTPATAVATLAHGATLVRDGSPDFLLLKRGDTWRAEDLGADRVQRRFKSGRSAAERMVIYSYGDSDERPRLEIDKPFLDDDGNERSYLAIVGLAFISFPKVPNDPAFNGADGGALRFVGTGRDILIEDNYVEYGEFTVQNVTDAEVRNNVVYRSYHVDTCLYESDGTRNPNGSNTYRPSGIFAGGVDGLWIEGNIFDENGWNPDVAEACATIYNHDLYLSGNSRLTVRDNLIMRASSIGIKMSSGAPGESTDILIENNLFAEGEIGISMGGNADTEHRFVNAEVLNNVFTDIGRAQPTTRTLTWYIELLDNDNTLVQGNLLVNQPELNNPYGIRLGGGTNRDVMVQGNLFYGLQRRNLVVVPAAGWTSASIEQNRFVNQTAEACLISHEGDFDLIRYADNSYSSAAPEADWFCTDAGRLTLADWITASGESGASEENFTAPDEGRNLDSYAEHLGIGSTLPEFAAAARRLSRHRFRAELTAQNANNYIREGFGVDPL